LAIALLIASAYALFRPISEVISGMIEIYHVNEQIIRFSALFYNPNNLGLVCELGLCILAYYYITNKCTKRHVVYMSPKGEVLSQKKAREFAENYDNIVILCGHYEGVDQRLIDEIVDEEISIGNYVLTGGEIPACVLVDCVSRMLEGVLSNAECYEKESFSDGETLEYPQYTRPVEWRGRKVPEVLLSGHHGNIDKWREEEAKRATEARKKKLGLE
jgi:tRNA (guanine37-N1)-methyltransferase